MTRRETLHTVAEAVLTLDARGTTDLFGPVEVKARVNRLNKHAEYRVELTATRADADGETDEDVGRVFAVLDGLRNPLDDRVQLAALEARRSAAESEVPPDRKRVAALEKEIDRVRRLAGAAPADDDDALYFYRLALFHEDLRGEQFAQMSQTLGFESGLLAAPAAVNAREPLLFPATRWPLGCEPGGFVFDNEKWVHEVELPEFEIDAQPVSWQQFAQFVEDGGYDAQEFWHPQGWEWLQREGRRSPRHVDQLRHGVLAQRFGKLMRVPMAQPAMHLAWYEADAWCRWAGRRLPSEVEWEAAAHQGASRGLRWGDVWEWTATTFRPYPGLAPGPLREYSQAAFGTHKVLRGASFATRSRVRSPKFRHFAQPDRDDLFCGFRSCAL